MKEQESLGRLERIDLRKVWANESANFTPWLAKEENLKVLAEAIGIELELEATEEDVGPFRADLVCRDTGSDVRVLIENQLERTNHTHLGQLMTYAAGPDPVTIVWVAERFTDEHRAALDWLNEVTSDSVNLFGLEIELWRIGESPIAPKFNVVSEPNDWVKTRASLEAGGLTEAKALQVEFWKTFRDYVEERRSVVRPTKALPHHWMNISIGRTGFRLSAVASLYDSEENTFGGHELRAELVLDDGRADEHFLALQAEKDAIEQTIGEPLTWHRPENARMRRIYVRRGADLESRKDWPEYHAWLLAKLELFHKTFAPRVRDLD